MIWIRKLIQARRAKPMNTVFSVLCGTIIVSAMLFGVLLLRVPLSEKDFWLKALSAVLASLVFAVGIPALIVGHIAGKALEREIEDTKGKLEAEQLARLELEESIAPRILKVTGNTTNKLAEFVPTSFAIECVPDGEALRTAGQIRFALTQAGWGDLGTAPAISEPEGIRIEKVSRSDEIDPSPAARVLTSYLEANEVEARSGPYIRRPLGAPPEMLPDGTVKIRIGLKPSPYFTGKLLDEKVRETYKASRLAEKKRRGRLKDEWFPAPPLQ
jgi:hypothetical protein